MSLRKVILLVIPIMYFNIIQVFAQGVEGISAYSIGGAIMQTNDLLNSGSQLNWSFTNNSNANVTLLSMQLIDGVTKVEGNLMSVNQIVEVGSTVSYTTTISALGIHVPVTCRFRYNYGGRDYSIDAVYTGSFGPDPIDPLGNSKLIIKATGNGIATYNGKSIRNSSESFSINFLSEATISFTPDNGYCIKYVKVNNTDVTSEITNNQYKISSITSNQTVEVVFEATPTFTITSKGGGYVSYAYTVIRDETSQFTVNEGASATISFTPDNGYRIKYVKVNNIDVTSKVSNNKYTISSLGSGTSLVVEFEVDPIKTYKLSITALGSGYASYNNNPICNQTSLFTIDEKTSATISFVSDNGYRIKYVKVNNIDVTSSLKNNQYTISNISSNNSVEVEFEAIPIITYDLSITATGSGTASYNGETVRNMTSVFSVKEGTSVTISFTPDNDHRIRNVKINNTDVTSTVSNNKYTINSINSNTTLEVEFAEEIKNFEDSGINYSVISVKEKIVCVTNGNYGQFLVVPAEVTYDNILWKVIDIDNTVLLSNEQLAAVIWGPDIQFNAEVSNPNFLLYVKDEKYASRTVKNVVVNNVAESIELTDAASGNDFYCPRAFTARKISYSHHYNMETGLGESKGWETIVLPFDVQSYTHATKGEIEPFTTWSMGSNKIPFWLFELTADNYKDVAGIKANTPYIISMPNNRQYEQQYQIPGIVTFSATNAEVKKSDDLKPVSYQGRTFVPNYTNKSGDDVLALNVNSYYVTNPGKETDGSKFVRGLRAVHPFEAYMTTTDDTRSIDVLDGMATDIKDIEINEDGVNNLKVYDIRGVLLKTSSNNNDALKGLKAGIYIVDGKKIIIK